MKRHWKILCFILLLILFCLLTFKVSGRELPTPFPHPPIVTIENKLYFPLALNEYPIAYGSASGQFVNNISNKPISAGYIIWFGRIYCDHNGEGCCFIVDTARSPAGLTNDNGEFLITEIPSGKYVIVITVGEFIAYDIVRENGKPKVWRIHPEGHLDTGILKTWLEEPNDTNTTQQKGNIYKFELSTGLLH